MSLPSFKTLFRSREDISQEVELAELKKAFEQLNETHNELLLENVAKISKIDTLTELLEKEANRGGAAIKEAAHLKRRMEEIEASRKSALSFFEQQSKEQGEQIVAEKSLTAQLLEEKAKLTEENERLRTRLARTGLDLAKLKTLEAKTNRPIEPKQPPVDTTDPLDDIAEGGLRKLVALHPNDIIVSLQYEDKAAGYMSNILVERISQTKGGNNLSKAIDAMTSIQLSRLFGYFSREYVNFHNDYYNSMVVMAALSESDLHRQDEVKEAARMGKILGAQATVTTAIINAAPYGTSFEKGSERTIEIFKEIVTYIGNNTEVSLTQKDLCKSFEVSTATIKRYVYLTLLFTESKNLADWGKEL